jgi:hypothetical protein
VRSIKAALKALADLNDTRAAKFPLDLENSTSSISREAASLHLFHHQVSEVSSAFIAAQAERIHKGYYLWH